MAETPQGKDLVQGTIDLGDGIRIENRLRLGTVIRLEDKLGKSIGEYFGALDVNNMKMKEIQPLIVALILQANDGMTEEEAERLSMRVDLASLGDVVANVMSFEPKNSLPPEVDLTESPAA